MDYKKKYNEAQKWIESIYTELSHEQQMEAEAFFPELKESEDEKMMHQLHSWMKEFGGAEEYTEKVYTWLKSLLEKQGEQKSIDNLTQQEAMDIAVAKCFNEGEQKPANKVEPKFHEGEWITNGDYTWKIVEVKPLDYILQSQEGNIVDDTISHVDEQFHSFTIKDAKDGDVLAGKIDGDNYILIFKQIKDGWVETYGHYYDAVDRFCVPSQLFCRDYKGTFHPATKEQRDTLFAKMQEAGYEWDTEKKELKKISQRMVSAEAKEALYDKPAWSEEDETKMRAALAFIKSEFPKKGNEEIMEDTIEWLKSLRPQPKCEWSKVDEKIRQTIINEFEQCSEWCCSNGLTKEDCINWLKKQEYFKWGDEDNENMNSLCVLLDQMVSINAIGNEHSIEYKNWLKSLKERYTWKPSEEQIVVLELASKYERVFTPEQIDILIDLKEQLKKLKVE